MIYDGIKNLELPEATFRMIEETIGALQNCYQPDDWADDNNYKARIFINNLEEVIDYCEAITKRQREKFINKLKDKIDEYLDGWNIHHTSALLNEFYETHGWHHIIAMNNYIIWSEEHNKKPSTVAITLAHDLNGCSDKLMLPRTSSFMRTTSKT